VHFCKAVITLCGLFYLAASTENNEFRKVQSELHHYVWPQPQILKISTVSCTVASSSVHSVGLDPRHARKSTEIERVKK
jgi:hypothetical protein